MMDPSPINEALLKSLQREADLEISEAKDINLLEDIRIKYLGKKGSVSLLLAQLKNIPTETRPQMGQYVNECKQFIQDKILKKKKLLEEARLQEKITQESIDITLPSRSNRQGTLHPITSCMQRITEIFKSIGYQVVDGPEIEDDFHNFEALNIPSDHPAKAMHDTFYLKNLPFLLRTHTSPVQIRAMESRQPPIQIICPGKVYRRDSDLTHTPMFHQLEGLVVDQSIGIPQLKQVIQAFLSSFFEKELATRFRPSYFPFTEPSAEVDVQCPYCTSHSICRVCHSTGWLEVMGCGIVHPNVLKNVHIDSDIYSGFAFGFGIDRLTMLYYGINDLRLLFDNQIDFLEQF